MSPLEPTPPPVPNQELHSLLESFRCKDPVTGPLVSGLRDSDRILIASFASPSVTRRFRRELAAAGVESTMMAEGIKTRVEVCYSDRDRAFALLHKQQREYPDQYPATMRRDYDFAIFGSLIGLVMGLSSLLDDSSNRSLRLLIWVGATGTGTMMGYFVDRICRGFRYGGRMQVQVLDLFLFTFAIALLITFWTTIARLQ